ncbi:hypothetical protein F5887DRAFT_1190034 [Amanita rubescens]|nr:hypothetical protein F5887DRAFT_1190034 [Amanita rubescens]
MYGYGDPIDIRASAFRRAWFSCHQLPSAVAAPAAANSDQAVLFWQQENPANYHQLSLSGVPPKVESKHCTSPGRWRHQFRTYLKEITTQNDNDMGITLTSNTILVLSEAVDTSLDVSSIMITTLRDVSKITPIPLLWAAAGIVVDIIDAVQKARRNKRGFKKLAEDSCELVYVVILAHNDDAPDDLTKNLQQLVDTLTSIKRFAERGALRNYFQAFFHSGVDADKIREYREKLQQSMRVFGLQSDIILRETVAKLASRQNEMMNKLQNRAQPVPIISSESEDAKRLLTSTSISPRIKVEPMAVQENREMTPRATTDTMMTNSVPAQYDGNWQFL